MNVKVVIKQKGKPLFEWLITTVRLSIEQIQLVIWRRIVVVVVNVLKGAEKLDFLERVDG